MGTQTVQEVNFHVSWMQDSQEGHKTYILSIDRDYQPISPSPLNSMSQAFPAIANEIKFCIAGYLELAKKNGGHVPKFHVRTASAFQSDMGWLYGGGHLLTEDEQRMLREQIEVGFCGRPERPVIEYFSPNGNH